MIPSLITSPAWLVASGSVALAIIVFQILQGKRIIKFKGALHRKVHRASAWILVGAALLHGLSGYGLWLRLTGAL